jgi:hypothetical protein
MGSRSARLDPSALLAESGRFAAALLPLAARAALLHRHPFLSPFTTFDPERPRAARIGALALELLSTLFLSGALYVGWRGVRGTDSLVTLPSLSGGDVVILAILTALLAAPVNAIIGEAVRRAGRASFAWR